MADAKNPSSSTAVGTASAQNNPPQAQDPLEAERDNPRAIRAMMERHGVDEATATEMWHLVVDTVAQVRDRVAARGDA